MGKTFGWRRHVAFGKPAYKHPVVGIFGNLGTWIGIALAGIGIWWTLSWIYFLWKDS